MKKKAGSLLSGAVSALLAVSMTVTGASAEFPAESAYAQPDSYAEPEVYAAQQEAQTGIGELVHGERRLGDGWYWDGQNTLKLYGIEMSGTGAEQLFSTEYDQPITVELTGYNYIENFGSMTRGCHILIKGTGILEAENIDAMWGSDGDNNMIVEINCGYLKAAGNCLMDSGDLHVSGGYIDAPGMQVSNCREYYQFGGYINISGLSFCDDSNGACVNGGFLKLENSFENGTLYYRGCVIQMGNADSARGNLYLVKDDAVLIVENPGAAVVEDLFSTNTKPAVFDQTDSSGRAVMCHSIIDVSTSPSVDTETIGAYYKGSGQVIFTGGLSGANYVESSANVSMDGFSNHGATLVSASLSTSVGAIGKEKCTIITLGELTMVRTQAAGCNSQIISTGNVTAHGVTADNLIVVTDTVEPALKASDSTFSGSMTAYNRSGNTVELDGGCDFYGSITSYSYGYSAFKLNNYNFAVGENTQISATAPNTYRYSGAFVTDKDKKAIAKDSMFPGKRFYTAKNHQPLKIRSTLEVLGNLHDDYGYTKLFIGGELFPDIANDFNWDNDTGTLNVNTVLLPCRVTDPADTVGANMYLVSSSKIDNPRDVTARVYAPDGTDVTDKFTFSYALCGDGYKDPDRSVNIYFTLKYGECLDIGNYNVVAEYDGLTASMIMQVFPCNVSLNFCVPADYIESDPENYGWTYEVPFTGFETNCKGETWEWYGAGSDEYEPYTLVLDGFQLYTSEHTLFLPAYATIILRGKNTLDSNISVITSQQYNSAASLTIIGEEDSSLFLTSRSIENSPWKNGVITLGSYGELTLRNCNLFVTALDSDGSDVTACINASNKLTIENSDVTIDSDGSAAAVRAFYYRFIGSSLLFANADTIIDSEDGNGISVQAFETVNIKDLNTESFNEAVKSGNRFGTLTRALNSGYATIRTIGISQTEENILLGGDGFVHGAKDIKLDLNDYFTGGTGKYVFELEPGAKLPEWVEFNQGTGTFTVSQVPDEGSDSIEIGIIVKDAVEELREHEALRTTMTIGAVTTQYTLDLKPVEHGIFYIEDPNSLVYNKGEEAHIRVVTEKGWRVKSVKLNGTEITPDENGIYSFVMTCNSVVAAETEQITHALTVISGGNGTVTPGSGEFPEGTEVTLTVTPDEGYQVKSAKLNGKEVALTDGKYTLTVTEDCTFEAQFEAVPKDSRTVTVSCGAGGTVTPGTRAYEEGTEVTLTVTPDEGYQVKSAKLNGKEVALTDGKYTLTVTEDCTFEVQFVKKSSGGSSGGSTGGSTGGSGGSYRPSRPSGDGSTPAVNGKNVSWSDVVSMISGLPSGGSLVINLNGETQVPAEVIRAIYEKRAKVEFVIDSAKGWIIDGAKIIAITGADLTALPGKADKTALRGTVGADLKISGTNVPAELKLTFRKEFAGQFANVYKLNGGVLEFQRCVKVGADGTAVIPGADAAGEYVVMVCKFSDLPGDADNDGVLSALDASAVLKETVGMAKSANPAMCDFNGDGEVNALDAAAMLKAIVGAR